MADLICVSATGGVHVAVAEQLDGNEGPPIVFNADLWNQEDFGFCADGGQVRDLIL